MTGSRDILSQHQLSAWCPGLQGRSLLCPTCYFLNVGLVELKQGPVKRENDEFTMRTMQTTFDFIPGPLIG